MIGFLYLRTTENRPVTAVLPRSQNEKPNSAGRDGGVPGWLVGLDVTRAAFSQESNRITAPCSTVQLSLQRVDQKLADTLEYVTRLVNGVRLKEKKTFIWG